MGEVEQVRRSAGKNDTTRLQDICQVKKCTERHCAPWQEKDKRPGSTTTL